MIFMTDTNKFSEQDLKDLAEDLLVKSVDEISDNKEIIWKIEDKIIFVKETKSVDVIYKTEDVQEKIGLYLIAKFIGYKVLNIFDEPTAGSTEMSSNFNLSPQALAPSLGVLSKEFIEKENEKYKIKAYKILDFLDRLDKNTTSQNGKRKKNTRKKVIEESSEIEIILKKDGFDNLSSFLGITKEDLKKLFFVRENDMRIIDAKFVENSSVKETQLDMSLAYLISYKYFFGIEEFPASLLRKKLRLMGIKSLVNLTTHLHKFPEFIIHSAGKKGSVNNKFLITQPGENRIKKIIKNYFGVEDNE